MEYRGPEESIQGLMPPLPEDEVRHSPLQLHFLRRLNRLLNLRYEQGTQLNTEGVRLLDRSIYATYCDCVDLGVGDKAQQLLRRFPVPSPGRSES